MSSMVLVPVIPIASDLNIQKRVMCLRILYPVFIFTDVFWFILFSCDFFQSTKSSFDWELSLRALEISDSSLCWNQKTHVQTYALSKTRTIDQSHMVAHTWAIVWRNGDCIYQCLLVMIFLARFSCSELKTWASNVRWSFPIDSL